MTLADGDPRVVTADLYAKLSRLEKGYADSAFRERLVLAGRNDPQYRDDEQPVLVAGAAIRAATWRLTLRIAQVAWGGFLLAALATIPWPDLKGTFMIAMLLAALVVSGAGLARAIWRDRQIARVVEPQRSLRTTTGPSGPMPVIDGRLGPEQLAPVLTARVTRFERMLVESFFPGNGRLSTGNPDWNGSPHDRLRLRRCFTAAGVTVLVLVALLGSLAGDAMLSWIVNGSDANMSGIFLVGWIVGVTWFVRRRGQVRRWYRAGIGHEAELARSAMPVPVPSGPRALSPGQKRWALAFGLAVPVFLASLGAWGVVSLLGVRADTQPYAEGLTTTGTVVKVLVNHGRGTTYRAVSRFEDEQGHAHTVTGQSGEQHPHVGERVRVSYLASDPADARELTTNINAWRFPLGTMIFIMAIGLLALAFAVVTVARGRGGRTSAPQQATPPHGT